MNIKLLALIVMCSSAIHCGESRYFQPAGTAAVEKFNVGTAANIILASDQGKQLIDHAGKVVATTVATSLAKTSVEAYAIGEAAGAGFVAGAGLKIKAAIVIA